jgi:hypothetical protein
MLPIPSSAHFRFRSVSPILPCIVLLFSILLTPILLRSQISNSAFLQGNIIAADGSRIPRANIKLLYVSTGTMYRSAAGDDGHYLIAGVRVGGPYTLRVSHIGFGTQLRSGSTSG